MTKAPLFKHGVVFLCLWILDVWYNNGTETVRNEDNVGGDVALFFIIPFLLTDMPKGHISECIFFVHVLTPPKFWLLNKE